MKHNFLKIKHKEVTYRPWESDYWNAVCDGAELRLSRERIYTLGNYLQYAMAEQGDVIEMGVYKGCTAYVLGSIINSNDNGKRVMYLCDTFTGTPETFCKDKGDRDRSGKYSDTSLEYVKMKMNQCFDRCVFVQGFIPDSLTGIGDAVKFCFAHIHLNLYESTRTAVLWLRDRMNRGGLVFIEDYGICDCKGVRRAVDELVDEGILRIVYLPTGQAVASIVEGGIID